jgi:hypothetical protein
MHIRASLLILVTMIYSLPVSAASDMLCHLNGPGGASYDASFQGQQATLIVDGASIPAAGPCFPIAHGQPFDGATTLCSFGNTQDRIVLYPIFPNNGFGKQAAMGVIAWHGNTVTFSGSTVNCH